MKTLSLENNSYIFNNIISYSESNFDDLLNTLCHAKNGDEKAILFFIEKYQLLIKKYAFKYKLKNYDTDDLLQIGNMAVIIVINKYDIDKGGKFIDSYIINSVKNKFKNLARNQIKYQNESSLNINIDKGIEIEDIISDSFNLEDHIINSMLNDFIKSTLTDSEFELIRIAYLTENCTLYKYCTENNLNYSKKRRELIALLSKIRKIIED